MQSLFADLVSVWPLDGGSGADAHGTNTLTDNGGVGSASGKISTAAQLVHANTEFLHIDDNPSLSPSGAFSVAGWVYADALGSDYTVFSKWGLTAATHREYNLAYDSSFGVLRFTVGDGTSANAVYATDFGALETGRWYFVVCWYGNGKIGVRVNGVETTATQSSAPLSGSGRFLLGGLDTDNGGTTGFTWDGRLDQFYFWTRRLTPREMTWLYNNGAGRSYADMVPFDDVAYAWETHTPRTLQEFPTHTENFNNGGVTEDLAVYDPDWVDMYPFDNADEVIVSSNHATYPGTVNVAARYMGASFGDDHYAQGLVGGHKAYFGLMVWASGTAPANDAQGYVWFPSLGLYKFAADGSGGVFVVINDGATWSQGEVGDTLLFGASGGKLYGFRNGVRVASYSPVTPLTGGAPGIYLGNTLGAYVDDFECGPFSYPVTRAEQFAEAIWEYSTRELTSTGVDPADLTHAIYVHPDGTFEVRESGVEVEDESGSPISEGTPTLFKIRRTGTLIEVFRDGVLIHTSATASTGEIELQAIIDAEGAEDGIKAASYVDADVDVTPQSVSDTAAVSVSESATVIPLVAVTDTAAVAVSETTTNALTSDRTDTTAVSVSEAVTVEAAQSISDTADVSLTESVTVAVVLEVAETVNVSVTETTAVTAQVDAADTTALAVQESTSGFVASDVSDSTDVIATDTAAVLAGILTLDAVDITVTETSSVVATRDVADTTDLTLTESVTLLVTVDVTDTVNVFVTEAGIEPEAARSVSDTPTLTLTESAQSDLTSAVTDTTDISVTETVTISVVVTASDTVDISVSDASTHALSTDVTDTSGVSVTETATSLVMSDVTDTTSVSVSDSSNVQMGEDNKSASDTVAVSVTDAITAIAIESSYADTVTLSLTETADLDRSLVETANLAVDESVSIVVARLVTETADVVVSESTPEMAAALSVVDTPSVSVTEALSTGVFVQPVDTCDLSVTETTPSPLLAMLTAADDGHVTITDAAAMSVLWEVNDSAVLSLQEMSEVTDMEGLLQLVVSEVLSLILTETILRAGPWFTPSDRIIVVDQDRIQVVDNDRIQVVERNNRIQ